MPALAGRLDDVADQFADFERVFFITAPDGDTPGTPVDISGWSAHYVARRGTQVWNGLDLTVGSGITIVTRDDLPGYETVNVPVFLVRADATLMVGSGNGSYGFKVVPNGIAANGYQLVFGDLTVRPQAAT